MLRTFTKVAKKLLIRFKMSEKELSRGKGWKGYEGVEHPTSKMIIQKTKSGKQIRGFSSMVEAAKYNKIEVGNISKACKGNRKTAGKFKWDYKYPTLQQVSQYTKKGLFIRNYSTMISASNATGATVPKILKCCKKELKTANGFIFTYK